ncbi:Peroxin 13, N-terminal region-domain-containing protein [Fomitopsis serialis]|uniref:Peroxin 13, N-terminal region-domain-containing protein n=1 Tax=Fomitopsis serialis TaxID=139415 RepID=UPI00200794A8|nr:Peroxin 13, N-terminal region-domain-containing protein [Neoantrodia serialis]KAH9918630.1 Peroxin 13, N-terminal region-domain-containing protein [Neoantrodia serialis]
MPSPPKPWERAGASAATATLSAPNPAPAPANTTSTTTPSTTAPSVPTRPAAFSGASSTLANPTAYGASPYSSYSAYNRPGSSYSPYGMNSMYGGGMGYGMGGMSGMGGMGGMGYGGYSPYGMGGYGGGGMYGAPFPGADPNNPSLTQTLEGATQHTFALLQSIVQTFGGVAQMLESTFVATHSSFFAMVGVVDQIGQLRTALGSVLGLFGLVRWLRDKLTGRTHDPLHSEFKDFVAGRAVQPQGAPAPRASKKPLIIFLLAVLGVPYLMHRLVRSLVARQQALAEQQGAGLPPLDPSQLTFARALYPFEAASPAELALRENEIVAIMGKLDPVTGAEVDPRLEVEGSEWWKGRTREGREGWFPKKFAQVLERRKAIDAPAAEPKPVE